MFPFHCIAQIFYAKILDNGLIIRIKKLSPEINLLATIKSANVTIDGDSVPRAFVERNLANFGSPATKLEMRTQIHPSRLFRKAMFRLQGHCFLIFLHALEIGQGLLARASPGGGRPLSPFLTENNQKWLKV